MSRKNKTQIGGLVQDCGNSSANALELPQSCTKPSTQWHDNSTITTPASSFRLYAPGTVSMWRIPTLVRANPDKSTLANWISFPPAQLEGEAQGNAHIPLFIRRFGGLAVDFGARVSEDRSQVVLPSLQRTTLRRHA